VNAPLLTYVMCYDNDCIAVVLPSFLVILQYNTGLYLYLSNIISESINMKPTINPAGIEPQSPRNSLAGYLLNL